MSTFNSVIAVSSLVGAFIFYVWNCLLFDNEGSYSERTKVRLARFIATDGIISIVMVGYVLISMQFEFPASGGWLIVNVVCAIVITLLFAGIGWYLFSLNGLSLSKKFARPRPAR